MRAGPSVHADLVVLEHGVAVLWMSHRVDNRWSVLTFSGGALGRSLESLVLIKCSAKNGFPSCEWTTSLICWASGL